MEKPFSTNENTSYIIYCEKHAPLKVKRTLEGKVKNYVDEISKFVRAIEKFYQSYKYKFEEVPDNEHKNLNYIKSNRKIYKKELKKPEVGKITPIDTKNPIKTPKEHIEVEPKVSPSKKLLQIPFISEVSREISKFQEFGNIWELKQTKKANKDEQAPKGTLMGFLAPKDGYKFLEWKKPKKEFLKNVVTKNHEVWPILASKKNSRAKTLYKKYKRIVECLKKPDVKYDELEKLESKFKTKCLVSIKKTGVNHNSMKDRQKQSKIVEKAKLKKIMNIKLKKKHENIKIRRIEKMVADELKESLLDNLNEKLNSSNLQLKSCNSKISGKESVSKMARKKSEADDHNLQIFNNTENQLVTKDQITAETPAVNFISNDTEDFTNDPQCICQLPWRGELVVECEECHEWFHPNCLGIGEMDECKLNLMFIMCVECAKKLNVHREIDQNIVNKVDQDIVKEVEEELVKEVDEEIVTENIAYYQELEELLGKRETIDLKETQIPDEIQQYPVCKLQNQNYAPQILYESNFDKSLPKPVPKETQPKKKNSANIHIENEAEFLFDARHLPKKAGRSLSNNSQKPTTKSSTDKNQEYIDDLKKITAEVHQENKNSVKKEELSKNIFMNLQQLKNKNTSITSFFSNKND